MLHKDTKLVIASTFFIAMGHRMAVFLLPLFIIDATSGTYIMASLSGVEYIPNIFFAIFIGVLVNHYSASYSLALAVILIVLSAFAMFLLSLGMVNPLLLFFISLVFFMGNYGFTNARSVFIKENYGTKELMAMNAIVNIAFEAVVMLCPFFAGFLIESGAGIAFFALLIICLIGGTLTLRYASFVTQPPQLRLRLFIKAIENISYLRSNRNLWRLTWVSMVNSVAVASINFSWLFVAKLTLLLDNYIIGCVIAAAGAGGMVGSFITIRWFRGIDDIMTMAKAMAIAVFVCALAALIPIFMLNGYGLALSCFIYSLCSSVVAVHIWTMRQLLTPKDMLGGVAGATSVIFKIGMPAAIMTVPFVYQQLGVDFLFLLPAALLFILSLYIIYGRFIRFNVIGN